MCARSVAADRLLDEVEHRAQVTGRSAHGQVQHQAVVGQLQELGQHVDRYVLAQHPGVALAGQPVPGRLRDGGGPLRPPSGERRVGAQPPGDLQLAAQPAGGVGGDGAGEQIAHHLHQTVAGHRLDHRRGVVLGDGEEE
ncbi:hypothetical protein ABZU92_11450 [Micromonospora arida]